VSVSTEPIYKGAGAPVDTRVADLLSRMTLAEKVVQMTQINRGYLASPGALFADGFGLTYR
jgi:beta-glucosidase